MTQATQTTLDRPVWVDLGAKDAGAAREFYEKLFGWQIDVNPDPMYGGYALAKVDGVDAAGIGPTQSPDQPSMWSIYIGTDDVDRLAEKVTAGLDGIEVPLRVAQPRRWFSLRAAWIPAADRVPHGADLAFWAGFRRETR